MYKEITIEINLEDSLATWETTYKEFFFFTKLYIHSIVFIASLGFTLEC